MFTRKPDPTSPPPLPQVDVPQSLVSHPTVNRPVLDRSNGGVSLIDSDLVIKGNVVSTGRIQFDGKLIGDLDAKLVVIGEMAKIEGNLKSEECHVCGDVVGTIEARSIVIHSTGQVTGDLLHKELTIDQGANFNGKSQRTSGS